MRNLVTLILLTAGLAVGQPDPLAAWRSGVKIHAATPHRDCHTIHSYFNVSPESPDGRWVLYYASETPEGHHGSIRILQRATGEERILARNVTTEDAHRAACQQWVSGGRRVVFHDLRNGTWVVAVVDIDTGKERVLASDRLVSWGAPNGDVVPIYGKHWDPGPYRDLQLVNVATGEIRTAVTAEAVRKTYSAEVTRQFAQRPISIFFPILSPDGRRVIFKLATPAGGDFRSAQSSQREMLIGYDLRESRFLFLQSRWGHPTWESDSATLLNIGTLTDTGTGAVRRISGLPKFPGSHPSAGPDPRIFATDTMTTPFEGKPGEWGLVVADANGSAWTMLYRFDGSHGATSWRRSHPHPAFSADGRRIYFNVNAGRWTELYVAER